MKYHVCGVNVTVDAGATRAAYARMASLSRFRCPCVYCRNFRALGQDAFPPEILSFFSTVGIPPEEFAEVYEYYQTRPGYHLYGGEYYFVGSAPFVAEPMDMTSGAFVFEFTPPSPLMPVEFPSEGAVCFHFAVELPWVIADAP